MIAAQDVIEVLKSRLDAEGSDFYDVEEDYIPAINSAVRYVIAILEYLYEQNKVTSEVLSELQVARVYETSDLSRIFINEPHNDFGDVWGILSVNPLPSTRRIENDASNALNPDELPYIGGSDSKYRYDLQHIRSNYAAKRVTKEKWEDSSGNPFAAGNTIQDCSTLENGSNDNIEFGYLAPIRYLYADPTLTQEIEIRPYIPKKLCTVFVIEEPSPLYLDENGEIIGVIQLPVKLFNFVTEKALNYIAYEQGDGTNIYSLSANDIKTITQMFI